MAAYVVAQVTVTKPEAYAEYAKLAAPAIAKHGGKYLVRGGKTESLEGSWLPSRFVVVEFASVAAAKAFYNSVDYQAARQKRLGAADFHMFVVEGHAG
jgi:uncharacterized protein (DUF1330 family)